MDEVLIGAVAVVVSLLILVGVLKALAAED